MQPFVEKGPWAFFDRLSVPVPGKSPGGGGVSLLFNAKKYKFAVDFYISWVYNFTRRNAPLLGS